MYDKKRYVVLDYFRVFAAFLITAIHTSPLSSVSKTADFLFTYCFGRIGVPFFLMVTGYFILGPFLKSEDRTGNYIDIHNETNMGRFIKNLKKTDAIYLIATILYLPVNCYSKNLPDGFLDALKCTFFDGTFYHLWYLPAAIIGMILVLCLLKWAGIRRTGIVVSVLYLVGLFGDSYYMLSERLPVLKKIYDGIFTISSYTRNGIFFAPVFFYLGTLIFILKKRPVLKINIIGLTASMLLMLAEGYLTYHFKLQRHNSMYLFLIPVMFFLFELLLRLSKKVKKYNTTVPFERIALWIYIIHPLCIILVRGAAKILRQTKWMVNNSVIHYFLVCILSAAASFAVVKLTDMIIKKLKGVSSHVSKRKSLD